MMVGIRAGLVAWAVAGPLLAGGVAYLAMLGREAIVVAGAVRAARNEEVTKCSEQRLEIGRTLDEAVKAGVEEAVAAARAARTPADLVALCKIDGAEPYADAIFERIEQVHREHGVTVLLVEQRVAEALSTCDYGYVLESGRIAMEGTHDTLQQNPDIKKAYLGM